MASRGELDGARISVRRIRSAVGGTGQAAGNAGSPESSRAARAEAEQRAAALGEQLTAREDRVSRRELRAPMDGIVEPRAAQYGGGVAKAGETIIELVPAEDTLLIAARVKPSKSPSSTPGRTG